MPDPYNADAVGIPAKAVACALLAMAGGAVAQDGVERRVTALIQQLHDPDALTRDTAMHRLVEIGRPAAMALRRILEESEEVDVAVVRTLGKMGPDALDSLGTLLDRLSEEHAPVVQTSLWHAALGIFPFSSDQRILGRVIDVLQETRQAHHQGTASQAEVELANTLVATAVIMDQLTRKNVGGSELAAWLSQFRASDLRQAVGVAVVLGRSGSEDVVVRQALRDVLIGPPSQDVPRQVIAPFAEAILHLDASSVEAIDAHAYLIQHGDNYQQQIAATTLREFGDGAGRAARGVTAAMKSDSVHARVLGELIITAGIIGSSADEEAKQAMAEALQGLAEHDDPQIAERAKAALRQLREAGHFDRPRARTVVCLTP